MGVAERVARRFTSGYSGPTTTIEIDLPTKCEGVNSLVALLKYLQTLGSMGGSREVEVGGVHITGWDGDGSDKIIEIRRDGEALDKPGKQESELFKKDHG